MSNYSELLLDPKWQKKRLEILELDNWRCRRCESKTKTLHVHHLYYIRGNKPWEYDNSALITYCHECHEECKAIKWQQAFYDLNLTEFDLLDIALQIRFRKEKHDLLVKDIHTKHKCRQLWMYMYFDVFKSEDEIKEFYSDEVDELRTKYSNG